MFLIELRAMLYSCTNESEVFMVVLVVSVCINAFSLGSKYVPICERLRCGFDNHISVLKYRIDFIEVGTSML